MKFFSLLVTFLACASFAAAGGNPAPEIDANTAGSAVALLSGGLMILRSRRKK